MKCDLAQVLKSLILYLSIDWLLCCNILLTGEQSIWIVINICVQFSFKFILVIITKRWIVIQAIQWRGTLSISDK